MATNDLMAELQKESIKLDDETERRVSFIKVSKQSHFVLGYARFDQIVGRQEWRGSELGS